MGRGHYVNNQDFLVAMTSYRETAIVSRSAGNGRPKIPDFIGVCFIKIAENLSQRPNFINYTFRDLMISDGIENCVRYLENFDPAKSKNPFAYFTQIVYYAFLRRIEEEKKQQYIKYKNAEITGLVDRLYSYQDHGDSTPQSEKNIVMGYQNVVEFIDEYEQKRKEKKEKRAARAIVIAKSRKNTTIEQFCENKK